MKFYAEKKPIGMMLLLILGAVCISFAPIFVKLIDPEELGPTPIGLWRTLIGGLILISFSAVKRLPFIPKPKTAIFALVAGFIFFVDLWFWHRSIIYIGAGLATILANTQVYGTAILSFLIFKERLTSRFIAASISALFGVVLLVGFASSEIVFTAVYIKGIAFGLATGLTYANYLIILKLANHKSIIPSKISFIGWTSLATALFFAVASLLEAGSEIPSTGKSWLILFSLAFVAQALGWWSITTALEKITAATAGLILLLQPTLATIWGYFLFNEELVISQVFGALVTLTAIYFGSLQKIQTK